MNLFFTSFFFIVFILLPAGYVVKDTKDTLIPAAPNAELIESVLSNNAFKGKIATTREEVRSMAKQDLGKQLLTLAITVPIFLVMFDILKRSKDKW